MANEFESKVVSGRRFAWDSRPYTDNDRAIVYRLFVYEPDVNAGIMLSEHIGSVVRAANRFHFAYYPLNFESMPFVTIGEAKAYGAGLVSYLHSLHTLDRR